MKIYKKLYLESLLPKEPYLSKIESVEIVISPFVNNGGKFQYVDFENPVNAHQFKPNYYLNSNNTLTCYCATITVAKHVQKAWKIYSKNFKPLKTKIKINNDYGSLNTTYDLYSPYIDVLLKNNPIHENVIIGRIDSINAFLKMLYIKNELGIDQFDLKRLYIRLEQHRLKHNLLSIHNSQIFKNFLGNNNFRKLESNFKLNTMRLGRYLETENIIYKNKGVTLVNLPWGQDLAFTLTKKLLTKNNKIKKIMIVGGVGSVADYVDIDDIFLATSTQDEKGNKIEFQNEFLGILPAGKKLISPSRLFSKRVCKGKLLCVNSSLGHKDDFSQIAKDKGISGFDMESYGILKAIKEVGVKTKIYMIHYIMDLPLKGLGLGATYYNKEFLKRLLSNFNRGKYFCFDWVLEQV